MYKGYLWLGLVLVLFLAYVYILYSTKKKLNYFFYFLAGSILGFYFDIVSYTNNYYTYPDFYKFTLLGLPISMTLAEGFSVAITIYIFEYVYAYLKKCRIV